MAIGLRTVRGRRGLDPFGQGPCSLVGGLCAVGGAGPVGVGPLVGRLRLLFELLGAQLIDAGQRPGTLLLRPDTGHLLAGDIDRAGWARLAHCTIRTGRTDVRRQLLRTVDGRTGPGTLGPLAGLRGLRTHIVIPGFAASVAGTAGTVG